MLKIIGFVTGTVLTALVMLFFAGSVSDTRAQGEFKDLLESVAGQVPERSTAIAAIEQPFSARAALETIADARTAEPSEERTDTEVQTPGEEAESTLEDAAVLPDDGSIVASNEEPPPPEGMSDAFAVDSVPAEETDDAGAWHAFWTPFRSEASANGFATRLGRDTDREYRVLRTGPGEYRVAFHHIDDNDRRARLVEIEQVSGLKLSGGEL